MSVAAAKVSQQAAAGSSLRAEDAAARSAAAADGPSAKQAAANQPPAQVALGAQGLAALVAQVLQCQCTSKWTHYLKGSVGDSINLCD